MKTNWDDQKVYSERIAKENFHLSFKILQDFQKSDFPWKWIKFADFLGLTKIHDVSKILKLRWKFSLANLSEQTFWSLQMVLEVNEKNDFPYWPDMPLNVCKFHRDCKMPVSQHFHKQTQNILFMKSCRAPSLLVIKCPSNMHFPKFLFQKYFAAFFHVCSKQSHFFHKWSSQF